MKAVILAGGFGTRLRPVIGDTPKCLAPVMGRPMVDLIIRNLKKQGITDITLSLHYQAEKFISKFGDTVKYAVEAVPLGTGGAIKNCIEDMEPILVVNGDTITSIDYNDMLSKHMPPLSIAKTPDGVSSGIYILNPEILNEYLAPFSMEHDVVPYVTHTVYPIEWFTDYGTPEAYAKACKDWD